MSGRERTAVQHGFHSHVASVRAALDPMAFVEAPVMPAPHFATDSALAGVRDPDVDRSTDRRRGLRGWWEQQLLRLVDQRSR